MGELYGAVLVSRKTYDGGELRQELFAVQSDSFLGAVQAAATYAEDNEMEVRYVRHMMKMITLVPGRMVKMGWTTASGRLEVAWE